MGGGASAVCDERATLGNGLGVCLQELSRPSPDLVAEAWARYDRQGRGHLGREEVLLVFDALLELQIRAAQAAATRRKLEAARQQAQLERECRRRRSELLSRGPEAAGRGDFEATAALSMGARAAPVMAGMMAGYMDIPIMCLTALKEDRELLEARVATLFARSAVVVAPSPAGAGAAPAAAASAAAAAAAAGAAPGTSASAPLSSGDLTRVAAGGGSGGGGGEVVSQEAFAADFLSLLERVPEAFAAERERLGLAGAASAGGASGASGGGCALQ